jgi:predicted DNA-binding antitoxin AbrB/MazE fold protein
MGDAKPKEEEGRELRLGYDQYIRRFIAARLRKYHCVSPLEHTEDVASEVWLYVFDNLAKLKEPDRFRLWQRSIARFMANAHLKNCPGKQTVLSTATATVEAVYEQGVLRPEEEIALEEGARVKVIVLTREPAAELTPSDSMTDIFELLEKCEVDTGISDLADQHDHYLYGKSKKDARC